MPQQPDPVPISLGKGSNKSRHGQEGIASFTNCYVEHLGDGGKVEWPIYAMNGLSVLATLAASPVRAGLEVDGTGYFVAGRRFYSVNQTGTVVTDLGGIPSDEFVTIARNRRKPNPDIVIVCDGQWFICNGGGFVQQNNPNLPPPIAVVSIDGFMVFVIADGRWFISSVDDATTIDPLNFLIANFAADNNVMAAVRGRELIIMGFRSLEFYVDNGGTGFPFSRIQTASIGCYAAGSVQKIILQPEGGPATDTVIWAATNNEGTFTGVSVLTGYSGTKISTPEVDRLIRAEPDPTNLRSMAWTENEHPFYCISGTNFSMVWDSRTNEWHARKSFGLPRWRASCHVQIGATHIFGDYATGQLYASAESVFTEAGNPIITEIVTPPVHMYPSRFVVDGLYLDVLTGVGVNSALNQDANPQLMLDYSDDGGASFGGQRALDLGAQGDPLIRIQESNFGLFGAAGVSFRLSCSAAVAKGFLAAAIVARKLAG